MKINRLGTLKEYLEGWDWEELPLFQITKEDADELLVLIRAREKHNERCKADRERKKNGAKSLNKN